MPTRLDPRVAAATWQARAVVASAAVLLGAPHLPASAQAVSCEELRARIEARIRGNGVQNFSVQIVDAAAKAPTGQDVGTCERGAKKLVYVKGPSRASPVITECADGRVLTEGECRPR